jgi:hypothetical protein
MALTPDERKKLLGHGGLARAAKLAKRSRSHMTQLNQLLRRDEKGERAITRVIVEKHPNVDPGTVWPPREESRDVAVAVGAESH